MCRRQYFLTFCRWSADWLLVNLVGHKPHFLQVWHLSTRFRQTQTWESCRWEQEEFYRFWSGWCDTSSCVASEAQCIRQKRQWDCFIATWSGDCLDWEHPLRHWEWRIWAVSQSIGWEKSLHDVWADGSFGCRSSCRAHLYSPTWRAKGEYFVEGVGISCSCHSSGIPGFWTWRKMLHRSSSQLLNGQGIDERGGCEEAAWEGACSSGQISRRIWLTPQNLVRNLRKHLAWPWQQL